MDQVHAVEPANWKVTEGESEHRNGIKSYFRRSLSLWSSQTLRLLILLLIIWRWCKLLLWKILWLRSERPLLGHLGCWSCSSIHLRNILIRNKNRCWKIRKPNLRICRGFFLVDCDNTSLTLFLLDETRKQFLPIQYSC